MLITNINNSSNNNNEYQYIEQLYKRIDILENENKSLKNNINHIISTLQNNYNIIIDLNNNIDNNIDNNNDYNNNKNNNIDNSNQIDNNSSISVYNCNSKCSDNGSRQFEFSELFYRVWHNVVLRNQILKHSYLLNKFNQVEIESHQELEAHQFREYITELEFTPSTPIRTGLLQSLSSLTRLVLEEFNQPLLAGMIPHGVCDLELWEYNHQLPNDKCAIPNSVTSLQLGSYDQVLAPNILPSSISFLQLGKFNQPLICGSIPSSVTELSLYSYELPLSKYSIPESVTSLLLHSYTNQSLKHLPSSVSTLALFEYGPIKEGTIPESITKLTIRYFEYEIKIGTLPSSIQCISLDRNEYFIGIDFQDAFYFNFNPKVNTKSINMKKFKINQLH